MLNQVTQIAARIRELREIPDIPAEKVAADIVRSRLLFQSKRAK